MCVQAVRKVVEERYAASAARARARQLLQEARNALETFLVGANAFLSDLEDDSAAVSDVCRFT
jgi:hypothetical protein